MTSAFTELPSPIGPEYTLNTSPVLPPPHTHTTHQKAKILNKASIKIQSDIPSK